MEYVGQVVPPKSVVVLAALARAAPENAVVLVNEVAPEKAFAPFRSGTAAPDVPIMPYVSKPLAAFGVLPIAVRAVELVVTVEGAAPAPPPTTIALAASAVLDDRTVLDEK